MSDDVSITTRISKLETGHAEHEKRLCELKEVEDYLFKASKDGEHVPLVTTVKNIEKDLKEHVDTHKESVKETKTTKDKWYWLIVGVTASGAIGLIVKECMAKIIALFSHGGTPQ